ncbi:MAG: GIY-YIG nuclease family protein [Eubacteriaceae bacterium]|jgi:putative endonuclease
MTEKDKKQKITTDSNKNPDKNPDRDTSGNAGKRIHYVYILSCADDSLYTGYTTDLENRLKTHNAGKGAKYTRSHLPVRLVYFEELESKGEALSREAQIKNLTRIQKLELIQHKE